MPDERKVMALPALLTIDLFRIVLLNSDFGNLVPGYGFRKLLFLDLF